MARQNDYIDEINKRIGRKIYMARLSTGHTCLDLAKMIDISYQQLRKYELGTNIASASRLVLIARTLGKDLSYFLENINIDNANEKQLTTQHHHICVNFVRNFMKIENPEQQKAVNNLVKMLAKAA